MITFLSLFLGLVLGPQQVAVQVDDAVARVEILLDDTSVATLTGPPWSTEVDLGPRLDLHRLEAVAYDAEGAEVGRDLQWLNMPRPPAEVRVRLDGGEGGEGRFAQVSWESVVGGRPSGVSVSLDGNPLEVSDPRRIPLPTFDPASLHFLRVELDFGPSLTSVAELVFGGTYADEVTSELTAVPIRLGKGDELPDLDVLQKWLTARGEAVRVVAAERGQAEVVIVRAPEAEEGLAGLRRSLSRNKLVPGRTLGFEAGRPTNAAQGTTPDLQQAYALADEQLRFVFPFAAQQQGSARAYALFPTSPELGGDQGGYLFLLTNVRAPEEAVATPQLADAVALAGNTVAGRSRRRAVVLLLGEGGEDDSQLPPELARSYLESLRVPLYVWSFGSRKETAESRWEPVELVNRPNRFNRAVELLQKDLDRQRILWVEGRHLPGEIRLTQAAAGVELLP